MSEQQLVYLQKVLADATLRGAIPIETMYIFSVALCVLQQQMEVYDTALVNEYGTRLQQQIDEIITNP